MDGQWPQQNSGVHTDLDLTIGSPGDYNQMLQELGEDLDGLLGFGPNTNVGNTGGTSAAAAYQDNNNNNGGEAAARRRFSKRHNREQIEHLEAAYREHQHPDEKQRRDLGRMLGITELQVKFWFQNRRSAQKTQEHRRGAKELQEVYDKLQDEHRALRLAMENNVCLACAGDKSRQQLLAENARLREALQRANVILKALSGGMMPEVTPVAMPSGPHYPNVGAGRAMAPDHALPPPSQVNPVMPANGGVVRSQRDTDAMLTDVAGRALQELCTVVRAGSPMWLPSHDGEVLNFHKYAETMFPSIFGPYRVGSVVDGTRKSGDVLCSADNLVGILMDAARWSEMFPSIVASATTSRIITSSASQHGMIQLMDAELRVLSPRVPVRKIKFVRQCQEVRPGKWAVVDVSVDAILGQEGGVPSTCRLLPSGSLIEVQNNSCCKVTWVVNMEYDETTVSPLYHPLIRSGQALGACRWLASLQRQCEYLALLHSYPAPGVGDTADISPDGRKNIFEVAQRMTRSFYKAMCGPGAQPLTSVDRWRGGCGIGFDRFEVDAQVVTFSAGSGAPGSVVLSATTTVWIPGIPAQQMFDYLCDGYRRGEWDNLANGAPIIQEGYFSTGQLPGNAVSVLRTIASNGTNGKLILQEARTDTSCMVLAYATLDDQSMQHAMSNGGLANLSLLPSGLVILPDGHSGPLPAACSSSTAVSDSSNTGSFVSVMYQTLLSGQPPQKPSLEAIDNAGNHLCRVIRKIKDAAHANRVVDA